jgi:hypothetical protein
MNGQRHSFDSTHAIRFDLASGAVRAANHDERLLLVPSSALDDLILSASAETVDAFGRSLGSVIGRRAAARLGSGGADVVRAASVESVVAQLAGEAAVAGVGVLALERWGRAMVVLVEDSPLPAPLLAPVVASALEAAAGRPVSCTLLARDGRSARVLVGSEGAVARVREAIAAGKSWGEAIVMLHGGRS